jgi:hypothetical protein
MKSERNHPLGKRFGVSLEKRIYGYWQVVVSKLSLSKSVRKTNAGPYDSEGEIPGGSPGMTAVQLLRGFTNDDLRKVRAGIISSLLNLIHSLVSTAHQGINICTIIGVDGNPDAGAD